MKHTALHLAVFGVLAGAALAAQAADVQIYGRVDAGFLYEHKKGEDTFTQKAGGRAHNRIGFNVVEDLGNGVKVKAYLENGFYIDNGQFDDSKVLFNRRSILALQGSLGEIGFGRMGTVQSTVAPYTMGLIKYDPFGTSYGNASIGSTFSNTSRTNNTVTWVSPTLNGFRVGASYSLGDKSDDLYANLADRRHTGALAVDYTGKDVYFNLNYGNVDYGNQEGKSKDSNGQAISFGGWYRFIPEARVFFGAQYSTHWEKGAGLAGSKVTAATAAEQNDGWEGYSLLLGTDYVIGSHKLIGGVQYYDGELSGNSDYNFRRTVFSAQSPP